MTKTDPQHLQALLNPSFSNGDGKPDHDRHRVNQAAHLHLSNDMPHAPSGYVLVDKRSNPFHCSIHRPWTVLRAVHDVNVEVP